MAASAPAVGVGNRVHQSFGQLSLRSAQLAETLRSEHGLSAGDTVALMMHNVPAFFEVFWGCLHAGLTVAPLNAKLHAKEIAFCLGRSSARAVFADGKLQSTVEDAVEQAGGTSSGVSLLRVGDEQWYASLFESDAARALEGAPAHALLDRVAAVEAGSPAWLFFTSGTTGRPKAAVLSHENLRAQSRAFLTDLHAVRPEEAMLHAAPLTHASGMYHIPHLAAGACNVVPASAAFDPSEVLHELLPRWAGACTFLAPTMLHRLCEADAASRASGEALEHLRTVVVGGGPLHVDLLRRAMGRFGEDRIVQVYGMGECPMTIAHLGRQWHRGADEALLRSVGWPFSHEVEVMVAGEQGERLPHGSIGEVCVRGSPVMSGYLGDEEATRRTFFPGGWLRTGDSGRLDPTRGCLTLEDRIKDMIIRGGSNIYPREVEEVLLTHEAVSEVAVVGVPHLEWGEEVAAALVPPPGTRREAREALEAELDELCLASLARFKRPRAYHWLDELPKNSTGKVLKRELRELLAEKAAGEEPAAAAA